MAVRQYVLTLSGVQQRLNAVLANTEVGGIDDIAARTITFQGGESNANAVFIGDSEVTAALWAWRIPAPVGGVPAAPLYHGEHESGPIKLSNFYVIGTADETLHIGVIPY